MRFVIRTAGWMVSSLVLSVQPAAASWIQGVVFEKTPAAVRPLGYAFVSMNASPGGTTISVTRTDGEGRYRFANVPAGRIAVAVSKAGYITTRASGKHDSTVVLDCSRSCGEVSVDFELSPAALLSGTVTDGLREPAVGATISLRPLDTSRAADKLLTTATDDRGRFRLAGIAAGLYVLTLSRGGPNRQNAVVTRSISVAGGEHINDISLSFEEQSFRVAGVLAGIPVASDERAWIEMQAAAGPGLRLQSPVAPDGRFQFEHVPPARYAATLAVAKRGGAERTDHFLTTLDVSSDLPAADLRIVDAATASGTVDLAGGVLPADPRIRFTSVDGYGYRWTPLEGAGRSFELSRMRPGAYRVEADSPQFYVKTVACNTKIAPPSFVELAPGVNKLKITIAADFSQVAGLVREKEGGDPVPHARVALYGAAGKYTAQADQAGQFLFSNVIPGAYRLCSWTNIEPAALADDAGWEKSGCRPVTAHVAPARRVEIDLGVAR